MAIHLITKLLPYLNSTTNYTNTIPCPDFCDPTCDNFDECYTFPANPHSLPPTTVETPSTSHDGFHISPLVIVLIIVLASAFLLVSFYVLVNKYCTFWTFPQSNQSPEDQPDTEPDESDPMVDHPIWLISTVGLHQSVINAITVIRYKKEDGLIDGTECSVCLSEFQEEETLRLLPKCNHAFHVDCIDTWLRSHTNCPLCRAGIVVNTGGPGGVVSNEPSFGHSRRTDFTHMGVSDSSDVEFGSTQGGNVNDVSGLVGENRGEIGNFEVDQEQNKGEICVNNVSILVIRRCYSMDYRNVGAPFWQENSSSNSNSNTRSFSFMGSSSSRPQPHSRVRNMKRSYSWSGRFLVNV